jgi:hypothetical protein
LYEDFDDFGGVERRSCLTGTLRTLQKSGVSDLWQSYAAQRDKRLNLKATTGCPPELSLPRTICWQRDPFTGTSPRITKDSTTTMHAWSAHVADAKHRITSSTAERYRRVIG